MNYFGGLNLGNKFAIEGIILTNYFGGQSELQAWERTWRGPIL